MKNLNLKPLFIPVVLLFVCLAAYGPMIAFLRYYWDDWHYVWLTNQIGVAGFPVFFIGDRPFAAWVFMVATSLFGERPLGYHILILLIRWLGVVGFWAVLRKTWPNYGRQAFYAALLFAVYPGFNQQPIALTYIFVLIDLAMLILSMLGALWALTNPRWFWPITALSTLLALVAHFTAEYYFGLEFLRPVLIWILLGKDHLAWRPRVKRTLLNWSPYLLVFIIFLVWRVFIYKFPSYAPVFINTFHESPLNALLHLASRMPQDMLRAGFTAWLTPLFSLPSYGKKTGLIVLGIFILSAMAIACFLNWRAKKGANDLAGDRKIWARQAILVGVFALFIAGFPAWVTDLPVTLDFPFNRFTLGFMAGSAQVIVALFELIPIKLRWVNITLISILAGGAIAWHFYNANTYRNDWKAMENFLWQLTWRVPGLKPGTSLLTNEIPFSYYTDNSFTPLINLTYAPQSKQFDLPYILLFINLRWGGKIPALVPGYPIVVRDRSTVFDSTTDHALVILYNPPHCLRVIDPAIDGKDSFLPFDIASALAVSHPDQILVNQQPAAVPPKDIFDLEQTHTWCYYFEKAELARQQQDWTEIAALGGDAYKISNHPKFATENLVFIEGYARAGQWKQALDLTHQTYAYDRNIQVMLCDTWARISRSHPTDAEGLSAIQAIGSAYACSDLQGP